MESAEEAVELLSLAETLDGDDPAVSQAAAVVLGALCAKAAALLNGGEAYAESGALWRLALRVDPESREAAYGRDQADKACELLRGVSRFAPPPAAPEDLLPPSEPKPKPGPGPGPEPEPEPELAAATHKTHTARRYRVVSTTLATDEVSTESAPVAVLRAGTEVQVRSVALDRRGKLRLQTGEGKSS